MERVIATCVCQHEFQDKQYGKQQRLHRKDKKDVLHCTVCAPIRLTTRMRQYANLHVPMHSMPPKSRGPIYQ